MLRFLTAAALIALECPVGGEEPRAPGPPPFRQLRYEEDYGYLKDAANREEPWDLIKYFPLRDRPGWYVSFGGEGRLRYERLDHPGWGEGPEDHDGYLLQRYLLHGDVHLGEPIRLFAQLQSSLEEGRRGGPRPTDEDRLDLHQAFLDWKTGLGEGRSLTLRGGRQEMAFGSSRLVSVRESPNVRLSFDGGRAILELGDLQVNGFVTQPVEVDPGTFDDGFEDPRTFWGVHATRPLPLSGNMDLYYLGLDRPEAEFDQGTADEERHSMGARIWGRLGNLDYNFEGVFQWGRFGGADIRAWTVASDTGYTLKERPLEPRLGLRADIISGDRDRDDPDLGTFNPLFPRGSYFGEIALLGPVNLIDLHPSLKLDPTDEVTVTLDCAFFWRETAGDGIYGNAVNLLRPASGTRARRIGSQPSAQVEWRPGRRLSFSLVYSHFFAGPFLKESGGGKDIDFVGVWGTFRF